MEKYIQDYCDRLDLLQEFTVRLMTPSFESESLIGSGYNKYIITNNVTKLTRYEKYELARNLAISSFDRVNNSNDFDQEITNILLECNLYIKIQ